MKKIIIFLVLFCLELTVQASTQSSTFKYLGSAPLLASEYTVSPVQVGSLQAFDEYLKAKKPVALFFTAKWCGPCCLVREKVDFLANEHPNMIFLIVDVDELPAIAVRYDVRNIPTIIFLNTSRTSTIRISGVQDTIDYEAAIATLN